MSKLGLALRAVFGLVGAGPLIVATMGCGSSASHSDAGAGDAGRDTKNGPTPLGFLCSEGVDPSIPLLTDFSSASYNAAKNKWGFTGNLTGTIYTFKNSDGPSAPKNASTANVKVAAEALSLSGEFVPEPTEDIRLGGGLQFDSCVNTTTYRGIQFNLTGTTGSCDVYSQLQTYSQQPTPDLGGCSSYCYKFPWKKVVPQSAPTVVMFSEMANTGIPASAEAMAAEIVGVRWLIRGASGAADAGPTGCTYALTIDAVRFVR